MSDRFTIDVEWERLETGTPEEQATFAALGIRVGDDWLTEAQDTFVNRIRQRVHLSSYHLAEWFAWNWWRLRWEPHRSSSGWLMSHQLTSIGGGYIWPNIQIIGDGRRVLLRAMPTEPRSSEPIRYIKSRSKLIAADEFEAGVTQFVETVLDRHPENQASWNLKSIWRSVLEERNDPEAAAYRRIEAELGYDPDELDEPVVEARLADRELLGFEGLAELVSEGSAHEELPNARELRELAVAVGFQVGLRDMPTLDQVAPLSPEPWMVGVRGAKLLREQERLGDGPLTNARLCQLAGTSESTIRLNQENATRFTYALAESGDHALLVLQPQHPTGRRFALARLLGDKLMSGLTEPLIPVMRSKTFRQKMQRAFAAELLCPFEQTKALLAGDLSEESQETVAIKYDVSPMLIQTQLVNNDLIDHDTLADF